MVVGVLQRGLAAVQDVRLAAGALAFSEQAAEGRQDGADGGLADVAAVGDVLVVGLEDIHHVWRRVIDTVDDRQRAGALLPIDRHVNLPAAVDAHQSRLDRMRIHGPADIVQVNVIARLQANGDVV